MLIKFINIVQFFENDNATDKFNFLSCELIMTISLNKNLTHPLWGPRWPTQWRDTLDAYYTAEWLSRIRI